MGQSYRIDLFSNTNDRWLNAIVHFGLTAKGCAHAIEVCDQHPRPAEDLPRFTEECREEGKSPRRRSWGNPGGIYPTTPTVGTIGLRSKGQ